MESNKKPQILVLIDWYYPGYKAGGPVRSCYNMIQQLKGDFEFKVITRNTEYGENKPYPNIEPDQWQQIEEGHKVLYCSEAFLKNKGIFKLIQKEEYDVCYINGVYSRRFSIEPLRALKHRTKVEVIVAPRGMLAQSAIKVKQSKKRIFLILAKFFKLYKNVTFHATNEQEANDIKKVLGDYKVTIIPNLGISTEGLKFNRKSKVKGELRIAMVARVAPEKNTLYAIQLFCYDIQGEVQFDLYGPVYNQKYWQECKAAVDQLPGNISFNYKGSLNAFEVIDKLSGYHLMLMPSRGENFGHAILESFAAGTPVLISNQTPWKNLKKEGVGWDIALDNKEGFKAVIDRVGAMDEQEINNLAKTVYKYGINYLDNKEYLMDYKEMFLND